MASSDAAFKAGHPESDVRSAALELDIPKQDIPKLDIPNGHPELTADPSFEAAFDAAFDALFDAAFEPGHPKLTADPRVTTRQFEKAWIDYVDPPTGCSWWTSLEDAITQGMIEERRSKWIGPNSISCGAFRIHAPENKSINNTNYQKIVTFEFFLWSDVIPQPTFEYLKRKIAQTLGVSTTDFFFETLSGKKLDAKEKMLTCFTDEVADAQDTINGQKLVDIRMVVPFLEWTLAE